MKRVILIVSWLGVAVVNGWSEQVIRIGIGTQDTTINCAAGGPVVRELHLLEKYLPHDGKYKDVEYDIQWLNLPTGAQLILKCSPIGLILSRWPPTSGVCTVIVTSFSGSQPWA